MFFSLNKKILYSLLSVMLLIMGIFFMIFINFYAQNLQDNQNSTYIRNQYVVSLLYDNIRFQKMLIELSQKYPQVHQYVKGRQQLVTAISDTEKELTREQQLNAELLKSYDKNREAVKTGMKIIATSLIAVFLIIVLLFFLLDYWVIRPIEKMTKISRDVSEGKLSGRVEQNSARRLIDEFDILGTTFNQMLDSMEQNIENVKMRERFLQQLIDAVPDAIRVLDNKYNVIMENKTFKNLAQTKGNCLKRKCFEAYGYNNYACPRSRYNCPIVYLKNKAQKSFHAIHEIGSVPAYISAARLYVDKNNKNDYYVIEAMHDLRGDVLFSHQQKISSLAFLSTSIAHEMKNNLGAIRMILEGILEEKEDKWSIAEVRKYLVMVHNQLVDTVRIPERLLKMSQYVDTEMTEIDVCSCITDVMQMTDYSTKRVGIATEVLLGKELYLKGNEADFKMIMLNLVQNAVKAMPNGGKLQVITNSNSHSVEIKVADTGVGIDEEKLKHIFEPFYSGNENVRSSGLGLAIVNSLVSKFNGSIKVKSTLGKGTVFILDFPLIHKKSK